MPCGDVILWHSSQMGISYATLQTNKTKQNENPFLLGNMIPELRMCLVLLARILIYVYMCIYIYICMHILIHLCLCK